MPKICYVDHNFNADSKNTIDKANEILEEYAQQGYDLTLRQLYYQFVARGLIPNLQKQYKRLGSIINDARMAGLIDWGYIVDRTRNLERLPDWHSPSSIIGACAEQFRFDKWEDQEYRPEVWIEKEALIGVIERVCNELQVPYLACKGYTSQSEMWVAAQRMVKYCEEEQMPYVIHLGDHDPSGIDMSRDIQNRIELFLEYEGYGGIEFKRIALNMDQINKYKPPPNPAKFTDSRATGYVSKFGASSWELDALEPKVMTDLICAAIKEVRDETLWEAQLEQEKKAKDALHFAANNWHRIQAIAENNDWSVESDSKPE